MGTPHINTKQNNMSDQEVQKAADDGGSFFSPGYQEPLFGGSCTDDVQGLLLSFCLPCTVMASNRANLDGRPFEWNDCFCPAVPYQTRQSLRHKYALDYAKINDCIAGWICAPCIINQEAREIAA